MSVGWIALRRLTGRIEAGVAEHRRIGHGLALIGVDHLVAKRYAIAGVAVVRTFVVLLTGQRGTADAFPLDAMVGALHGAGHRVDVVTGVGVGRMDAGRILTEVVGTFVSVVQACGGIDHGAPVGGVIARAASFAVIDRVRLSVLEAGALDKAGLRDGEVLALTQGVARVLGADQVVVAVSARAATGGGPAILGAAARVFHGETAEHVATFGGPAIRGAGTDILVVFRAADRIATADAVLRAFEGDFTGGIADRVAANRSDTATDPVGTDVLVGARLCIVAGLLIGDEHAPGEAVAGVVGADVLVVAERDIVPIHQRRLVELAVAVVVDAVADLFHGRGCVAV